MIKELLDRTFQNMENFEQILYNILWFVAAKWTKIVKLINTLN